MIRLENVKHGSGPFRFSCNVAIPARSLCAVVGPSGAGKTTLLNLVAGFERAESGRIFVDDRDLTRTVAADRPVSMVFQDHNVFAHLSVWDNVALGLSPSLRLDPAQREDIDAALQRVGLAQLAHRKPGAMSGGEVQRVALARVLVRKRPVLLLDEPFAALDPGLRKDMLRLVADLHQERQATTLLVTHHPEDAILICDHVVFVQDGIVTVPDRVNDFFANPDRAVRAYLGEALPARSTATAATTARKSSAARPR